jgi:GT2 family glycosyltransferase
MNEPIKYASAYSEAATIAFSIVVYKEVFYETLAFTTLLKTLSHIKFDDKPLILIYDNTDTDSWKINYNLEDLNVDVFYHHDSLNPGISVAYNHLSKIAKQRGYEWIVFLDQDTNLPEMAISEYILSIKRRPDVLVKTPVLMVKNIIFSPGRYVFKRGKILDHIEPGVKKIENYIFVNSGMLVNLSLFFKVGGYNERIKLDFADFVFLERVRQETFMFEVLPVVCQHHSSLFEDDINTALKRYLIFRKDLSNCPRKSLSDHIGYELLGLRHLLKMSIKYRSFKFIKARIQSIFN